MNIPNDRICSICTFISDSFSTCPKSSAHKWCTICTPKLRNKCPFCRCILIEQKETTEDGRRVFLGSRFLLQIPPRSRRLSFQHENEDNHNEENDRNGQ